MSLTAAQTRICLLSALFLVLICSTTEASAKSKDSRYARITVGSVEIKDWHHDIVKSYPNLSHYHWNPMYANVQGWNRVHPPRHGVKGVIPPSRKHGAAKKSTKKRLVRRKVGNQYVKYTPVRKRPKFIYKKPVHVASGSLSGNRRNTKARLNTKPIHISARDTAIKLKQQKRLEERNRRQKNHRTPITALQRNHSKADLRSDLRAPSTKAALRAIPDSRKAVDSRLARRNVKAVLTQKSTRAQLASGKTTLALNAGNTRGQLMRRTGSNFSPNSPDNSMEDRGSTPVLKTYKAYKSAAGGSESSFKNYGAGSGRTSVQYGSGQRSTTSVKGLLKTQK